MAELGRLWGVGDPGASGGVRDEWRADGGDRAGRGVRKVYRNGGEILVEGANLARLGDNQRTAYRARYMGFVF